MTIERRPEEATTLADFLVLALALSEGMESKRTSLAGKASGRMEAILELETRFERVSPI